MNDLRMKGRCPPVRNIQLHVVWLIHDPRSAGVTASAPGLPSVVRGAIESWHRFSNDKS